MNEGEIVAALTMEPRDESGNKVSILSRFQNKYISDNRTGSATAAKMIEVQSYHDTNKMDDDARVISSPYSLPIDGSIDLTERGRLLDNDGL